MTRIVFKRGQVLHREDELMQGVLFIEQGDVLVNMSTQVYGRALSEAMLFDLQVTLALLQRLSLGKAIMRSQTMQQAMNQTQQDGNHTRRAEGLSSSASTAPSPNLNLPILGSALPSTASTLSSLLRAISIAKARFAAATAVAKRSAAFASPSASQKSDDSNLPRSNQIKTLSQLQGQGLPIQGFDTSASTSKATTSGGDALLPPTALAHCIRLMEATGGAATLARLSSDGTITEPVGKVYEYIPPTDQKLSAHTTSSKLVISARQDSSESQQRPKGPQRLTRPQTAAAFLRQLSHTKSAKHTERSSKARPTREALLDASKTDSRPQDTGPTREKPVIELTPDLAKPIIQTTTETSSEKAITPSSLQTKLQALLEASEKVAFAGDSQSDELSTPSNLNVANTTGDTKSLGGPDATPRPGLSKQPTRRIDTPVKEVVIRLDYTEHVSNTMRLKKTASSAIEYATRRRQSIVSMTDGEKTQGRKADAPPSPKMTPSSQEDHSAQPSKAEGTNSKHDNVVRESTIKVERDEILSSAPAREFLRRSTLAEIRRSSLGSAVSPTDARRNSTVAALPETRRDSTIGTLTESRRKSVVETLPEARRNSAAALSVENRRNSITDGDHLSTISDDEMQSSPTFDSQFTLPLDPLRDAYREYVLQHADRELAAQRMRKIKQPTASVRLREAVLRTASAEKTSRDDNSLARTRSIGASLVGGERAGYVNDPRVIRAKQHELVSHLRRQQGLEKRMKAISLAAQSVLESDPHSAVLRQGILDSGIVDVYNQTQHAILSFPSAKPRDLNVPEKCDEKVDEIEQFQKQIAALPASVRLRLLAPSVVPSANVATYGTGTVLGEAELVWFRLRKMFNPSLALVPSSAAGSAAWHNFADAITGAELGSLALYRKDAPPRHRATAVVTSAYAIVTFIPFQVYSALVSYIFAQGIADEEDTVALLRAHSHSNAHRNSNGADDNVETTIALKPEILHQITSRPDCLRSMLASVASSLQQRLASLESTLARIGLSLSTTESIGEWSRYNFDSITKLVGTLTKEWSVTAIPGLRLEASGPRVNIAEPNERLEQLERNSERAERHIRAEQLRLTKRKADVKSMLLHPNGEQELKSAPEIDPLFSPGERWSDSERLAVAQLPLNPHASESIKQSATELLPKGGFGPDVLFRIRHSINLQREALSRITMGAVLAAASPSFASYWEGYRKDSRYTDIHYLMDGEESLRILARALTLGAKNRRALRRALWTGGRKSLKSHSDAATIEIFSEPSSNGLQKVPMSDEQEMDDLDDNDDYLDQGRHATQQHIMKAVDSSTATVAAGLQHQVGIGPEGRAALLASDAIVKKLYVALSTKSRATGELQARSCSMDMVANSSGSAVLHKSALVHAKEVRKQFLELELQNRASQRIEQMLNRLRRSLYMREAEKVPPSSSHHCDDAAGGHQDESEDALTERWVQEMLMEEEISQCWPSPEAKLKYGDIETGSSRVMEPELFKLLSPALSTASRHRAFGIHMGKFDEKRELANLQPPRSTPRVDVAAEPEAQVIRAKPSSRTLSPLVPGSEPVGRLFLLGTRKSLDAKENHHEVGGAQSIAYEGASTNSLEDVGGLSADKPITSSSVRAVMEVAAESPLSEKSLTKPERPVESFAVPLPTPRQRTIDQFPELTPNASVLDEYSALSARIYNNGARIPFRLSGDERQPLPKAHHGQLCNDIKQPPLRAVNNEIVKRKQDPMRPSQLNRLLSVTAIRKPTAEAPRLRTRETELVAEPKVVINPAINLVHALQQANLGPAEKFEVNPSEEVTGPQSNQSRLNEAIQPGSGSTLPQFTDHVAACSPTEERSECEASVVAESVDIAPDVVSVIDAEAMDNMGTELPPREDVASTRLHEDSVVLDPPNAQEREELMGALLRPDRQARLRQGVVAPLFQHVQIKHEVPRNQIDQAHETIDAVMPDALVMAMHVAHRPFVHSLYTVSPEPDLLTKAMDPYRHPTLKEVEVGYETKRKFIRSTLRNNEATLSSLDSTLMEEVKKGDANLGLSTHTQTLKALDTMRQRLENALEGNTEVITSGPEQMCDWTSSPRPYVLQSGPPPAPLTPRLPDQAWSIQDGLSRRVTDAALQSQRAIKNAQAKHAAKVHRANLAEHRRRLREIAHSREQLQASQSGPLPKPPSPRTGVGVQGKLAENAATAQVNNSNSAHEPGLGASMEQPSASQPEWVIEAESPWKIATIDNVRFPENFRPGCLVRTVVRVSTQTGEREESEEYEPISSNNIWRIC